MSNRRVVTLEAMFRRVATPSEIALIDKLYAEGHKGPAVRRMTDKVASVFHALLDESTASTDTVIKEISQFEDLSKSLIRPLV